VQVTLWTALAMAVPSSASAERPLTLSEALDLARRNNLDLRAARAVLLQTETGIAQARSALLPTAAAQGRYTHNYKEVTLDLALQNAGIVGLADVIKATSMNPVQNGVINAFEQGLAAAAAAQGPIIIQKQEQLDFTLSGTVPLVVPFAYPALSGAKKSYAASEANFGATETAVLFSAAQAFYAAAGTDELVAARRHAIEVADQALKNAQARFEAGVVNRVEVARAQLTLVRSTQAETEAQDGRAQAYRTLATILGLREPFVVATEGEPAVSSVPMGERVQVALRLRPEFAALTRTAEAQDAQRTSALWRWAPSLSAFGNVRAFNYPGFSGDNFAWAVGAQLDWVLFDGGVRDAARHLAAAQERESRIRLLHMRDTIADEIANASDALKTKRRALETARQSVALSKETLGLVQAQHDAGTATQLDLLQAQDALVNAEVAVAQARFDLAVADLSLARSSGTFPQSKDRP
jgi:outer membrane protein TolC